MLEVIDKRGWSFTLIDNKVITDTALTSNEKLAYIVLSMFSNKDKSKPVYPSMKTLCDYMAVTKPTAIKSTKGLEDKGYIEIVRTTRDDGGNNTNVYTLLPLSNLEGVKNFNYGGLKNYTKGSKDSLHEQEQYKLEQEKQDLSKDRCKAQSLQKDLFGNQKPNKSSSRKLTQQEQDLEKINLAKNTGDWGKITDRAFTHYYIEEHNKLFKHIEFDRYASVGTIRDSFIKKFSLPRKLVTQYIDHILKTYSEHPKKWDSLTFNMISKNTKLMKELVLEAEDVLTPRTGEFDHLVNKASKRGKNDTDSNQEVF